MAILIANKLLETETEAWYTFYVDTLEDIKDLPTSKTTGSSYKVKKLAKPASIAYCIEMAAQYALDDNDEWRLLYALRSDVADAILKKCGRNQADRCQYQRIGTGCGAERICGKCQRNRGQQVRKNLHRKCVFCGGK